MTDTVTSRRGEAVPGGGPSPRVLIWALHVALPLIGLWALLTEPRLDLEWEDHTAHLVLVAGAAAVAVALSAAVARVARERSDARLSLVSLAFLSASGFLFLHAILTPEVLAGPNASFNTATPIGLALASVFALASSAELRGTAADRVLGLEGRLRLALYALIAGWATISLLRVAPLGTPSSVEQTQGLLLLLATVAVALYGVAALRYWGIHRRRGAAFAAALITAFVLLAEATIATAVGRNWHASWWLWHLLMALAFAFVWYSARLGARREGSTTALFQSIALEQTLDDTRREYRDALERLVSVLQGAGAAGGSPGATGDAEGPLRSQLAAVATRFDLTSGQTEVLRQAAEALAADRSQLVRLDALAAVGREVTAGVDEARVIDDALGRIAPTFPRDHLSVGLLDDGKLRWPTDARPTLPEVPRLVEQVVLDGRTVETGARPGAALAVPLFVRGARVGVLFAERHQGVFADRERGVLEALAGQLSISLENARLYHRIDELFRQYLSPSVATTLLEDPTRASLGGAVREVTILFADLRGYTSFSERSDPTEVIAMLNRYFEAAVPIILAEGGTLVSFIGDALLAAFNAPGSVPDHPLRACRTALAMQAACDGIAAGRPDWPRFRVGVETGPAVVGNVGSAEVRDFTVIGDTTNVASRLQGMAGVGEVVIGPRTFDAVREVAVTEPLGGLELKGKQERVEAYRLLDLRGG